MVITNKSAQGVYCRNDRYGTYYAILMSSDQAVLIYDNGFATGKPEELFTSDDYVWIGPLNTDIPFHKSMGF